MKKFELQPDEYLGEDGLAYCKNCHTPRVYRYMANCNYEERTAHRIKGSCLFEQQLDCENMRDLVRKQNEEKLLKFINGGI